MGNCRELRSEEQELDSQHKSTEKKHVCFPDEQLVKIVFEWKGSQGGISL